MRSAWLLAQGWQGKVRLCPVPCSPDTWRVVQAARRASCKWRCGAWVPSGHRRRRGACASSGRLWGQGRVGRSGPRLQRRSRWNGCGGGEGAGRRLRGLALGPNARRPGGGGQGSGGAARGRPPGAGVRNCRHGAPSCRRVRGELAPSCSGTEQLVWPRHKRPSGSTPTCSTRAPFDQSGSGGTRDRSPPTDSASISPLARLARTNGGAGRSQDRGGAQHRGRNGER